MRRQRNIFDTFPDSVDLNQGPNYNGLDTNESDECNSNNNSNSNSNSRLSPNERLLLSNDLSGDPQKSQTFSGWDVGESSSRPNPQARVATNWPSSLDTRDSRFSLDTRDSRFPVGPLNTQGSRSKNIPMDVDLNIGYDASSSGTSDECGTSGSSGNSREPISVPPLSIPGVPENSQRFYAPINISSTGSYSNSSSSQQSSRRLSHSQYLDQTSTNSSHRSTQQMQVPGMPRNLLPFPWIGNGSSSRNGGSSSSSPLPREIRNSVQDPTNWSLGNSSSSSRNDNIWLPNLNSTTHSQQRSTDIPPPWTLFPSSEPESGGHRGRFRPFLSGPSSSSEDNVLLSGGNSSGRHHQPLIRSPPLMEVPGDEWQAFAGDIEGRHRLVSEMRQILHALRRGENLRAEDYMLFDPFINGVADLHDRHRDMRLDVDNMSYEELLALEERIGDVKTGLTEDVILKSMKQRKHILFMGISTQILEPCCICREEYENGDDIGTLDCGHDFHTCCIKQWLTQKNLCPICKMAGLAT